MTTSDEHAPTTDAAVLAEPMRSRWSPRILDETHVLADADLALLLEAARWAPSYGNTQPWSYVVLRRGGPGHRVLLDHLTPGNSRWVPRASAVLLTAVQVRPDPDGHDVKDPDFARYDAGQASAHLTLEARALGLHAHQFAGYDRPAVAAALGVPGHLELMAAIAVGVLGDPAGAPERDREREERPRTRRPLADSVHVERWGVPWPGARS